MTVEELFAAVLELPVEDVNEETAPRNVGHWTSRVQVQLIAAIEDVYRISLSAADFRALTSVGAARRILAGKGVSA
jgi:acyl carrier protein